MGGRAREARARAKRARHTIGQPFSYFHFGNLYQDVNFFENPGTRNPENKATARTVALFSGLCVHDSKTNSGISGDPSDF